MITIIENVFYDAQHMSIMLLTFLAVASFVVGLYYLFYGRSEFSGRLASLLKKPEQSTEDQNQKASLVDENSDGLAAKISKPLIKLAPADSAIKSSPIRLRLMQAGFRSKKAYFNYFACKVACAVIPPGIFLVTMVFINLTPERVLILATLSLAGFFLPDLILYLKIQSRKQELSKALPDALDLMVVCVEAGLGLDMTFKRVGEEIRGISKELSNEFMLTNLEVRSGLSRQESFKNMAMRTGVPEVSQLMSMLNQTSRFGTSLATALRVHSDSMRIKRRQTAEEIAAKAAIKLLFPLVLFIFPSLFVVLLGPAVIRVMRVLLPSIQGG